MTAAAADGGGGSDSNGAGGEGKQVKPHPGIVTPPKARKRKSKKRDRAERGSPDSTLTCITTTTATRGGDGIEELQQQTNGKKPRLVWTTELHAKFVRACRSLGRDVVPKKILEVMDVKGLTRENVASHLQKYRQKGQTTCRRGTGRMTSTYHRVQPFQAAFPGAQPVDEAAFPQAPPPSPSLNHPPDPPHGPFAAPNMSQLQLGHGDIVQALPHLVHPSHPDFPIVQATMPQLLYPSPQLLDEVEWRRKIIMEHQAQHAAMMKQAAVASSHNHHMLARNYELGAQALARAPATASRVQGHRLEPHVQASQAVNMNGDLVVGLCSVPEAGIIDAETEARTAQLQGAGESEGGHVPAAEPAFAGSADPDGGQQEDSCGVLHFWNTDSAPSMDHDFPSK